MLKVSRTDAEAPSDSVKKFRIEGDGEELEEQLDEIGEGRTMVCGACEFETKEADEMVHHIMQSDCGVRKDTAN